MHLSFGQGGGDGQHLGVSGDAWFEIASKSETGGVMSNIIARICALRQAVGPDVPCHTHASPPRRKDNYPQQI